MLTLSMSALGRTTHAGGGGANNWVRTARRRPLLALSGHGSTSDLKSAQCSKADIDRQPAGIAPLGGCRSILTDSPPLFTAGPLILARLTSCARP